MHSVNDRDHSDIDGRCSVANRRFPPPWSIKDIGA
jgi:hypothetical protein